MDKVKYNNFEIVEFVASTSGQYTIRATRSPSGDRGNEVINNQLGIAWSRQATYLPDVRRDSSGWNHSLTIRNDGAELRDVTVTFFLENGNFAASRSYAAENSGNLLQPNAVWSTSLPSSFSSFQGSAIVDGSEDLSVVVETIYDSGGRYLAAAYPGAMTPATAVYVPFFVKKWPTLHATWRQSSELLIQNTGSQQASVTVTIYDSWDNDSGSASQSYTIPAGGRQRVPATDFTQIWDYGGFLAAARVSTTSGQPLAVTVNTFTGSADGNGVITTPYLAGSYRAESQPTNTFYASTTAREYFGYDSSLQVQNARSGSATVVVNYYYFNTSTISVTKTITLEAYRSANLWRPGGMSAGFFGSATITSGGPLAVMAQYDRFDTGSSRYGVTQYEGVSSLNAATAMAHIQKEALYTPL